VQTYVTASAEKAGYQKANEGSMEGESQLQMLTRLELDKESHLHLIEHCKKTQHQIPFDGF
jgi:N,N'-diacetyllegionaminate synthase